MEKVNLPRGIEASTLNITPESIIVLHVDTNIVDLETAADACERVGDAFPNNIVMGLLSGLSIEDCRVDYLRELRSEIDRVIDEYESHKHKNVFPRWGNT